jgi:uncharacterized protein (DUF433 family)
VPRSGLHKGKLANNDTVEELLGEYPSLLREDILACLDY